MDLNEQIETVKLHVRALVERLKDVTAASKQEAAQLGALMLWSDRLANRCEEIGRK
jgi:hypothetical protein